MHSVLNFINLDYLKLMADGDTEMELTMLEMLTEELSSEFGIMESLSSDGKWEELTQVSHKMKSTLAFIGNEDLTTANQTIERLTKSGRLPNEEEIKVILEMIEQFAGLLPRVLDELQQVASSY